MKAAAILASMMFMAFAAPAPVAAQSLPCGLGPNDWCPAAAGDACGSHRNVAACRADPACYGVPYKGQSVVKCTYDKRGFGTNCPTVGCTSTPPAGASR